MKFDKLVKKVITEGSSKLDPKYPTELAKELVQQGQYKKYDADEYAAEEWER